MRETQPLFNFVLFFLKLSVISKDIRDFHVIAFIIKTTIALTTTFIKRLIYSYSI